MQAQLTADTGTEENDVAKNIQEQINEHESRSRFDTFNLVRVIREALAAHGVERSDTYTMSKAASAFLLDAHNAGSERESIPGIVAGVRNTHRHLQGKGVFAVLTALGHLPTLENATDARNEHAYAACEDLRGALSERIYWPE